MNDSTLSSDSLKYRAIPSGTAGVRTTSARDNRSRQLCPMPATASEVSEVSGDLKLKQRVLELGARTDIVNNVVPFGADHADA